MNVVITGANRGIGLGFAKHYLAAGHEVWAGYRMDQGELAEIREQRLHPFQLDVSAYISKHVMDTMPEQIDILINNAGIYGPDEQQLENTSAETMLDVFNVDCVGPLRVVQRLKERVTAARGVIANVSSKMGSSGDNSSGGCYAYRAAKAGLVIVSKSMARDLQASGVHVITLHPGYVRTGMTDGQGLIDVEEAVKGMVDVISRTGDYEPGAFVDYAGRVVPY